MIKQIKREIFLKLIRKTLLNKEAATQLKFLINIKRKSKKVSKIMNLNQGLQTNTRIQRNVSFIQTNSRQKKFYNQNLITNARVESNVSLIPKNYNLLSLTFKLRIVTRKLSNSQLNLFQKANKISFEVSCLSKNFQYQIFLSANSFKKQKTRINRDIEIETKSSLINYLFLQRIQFACQSTYNYVHLLIKIKKIYKLFILHKNKNTKKKYNIIQLSCIQIYFLIMNNFNQLQCIQNINFIQDSKIIHLYFYSQILYFIKEQKEQSYLFLKKDN
ncbi:hypothetical protein TTHERM_000471729 (macronuclear) [Tetrahymena thermophila SB210]|uniref:Uncharacterized protein n=1 Tax=Tetrahymena thermophila (strain SB210) TaxID=312017 RepID=W7X7I4_TETTS|nr:hypothetical protein TTHERM_000471729 [Tetrahymena thermophila SB210]EWS73317.1 hypothetical protein TTHERM_000471729 [Tetrahymena thermophila SB210]|eukprot:XP_012654166.1 hypothetical protein TTHERM_000471729 [Tetrahymena thermophila SB210]